ALRLADPRATQAEDLDLELARLYSDRVTVPPGRGRAGLLGSRASLRSHCSEVFRKAKLWSRLEKSVRASQFTFPGDPMRIDYGYRRNGTRGFVHTLSVTRAPAEAKMLAYTAERIEAGADSHGSLRRSPTFRSAIVIASASCGKPFARRASNPCPARDLRCGWPSCGPCCSERRR